MVRRMPSRWTFSLGSKQATEPSWARAAMTEISALKGTKPSRMAVVPMVSITGLEACTIGDVGKRRGGEAEIGEESFFALQRSWLTRSASRPGWIGRRASVPS